ISALRTATQGQTATAKADALSIWSQLHWYFFSQALSQLPSRIPVLIALQALIVTSLLLVPPMLLLYFQVAFLPYHDVAITWWHRGCLTIDVLLLLLFADSFWSANRNVAKQLSTGRSPFGSVHSPMRRFF